MTHLNIESLTLAGRNHEREAQKKRNRKKTILLLINQYLEINGFLRTVEALKSESQVDIEDYEMCDNFGLESIYQDFESYHYLKYQKLPIIAKKVPVVSTGRKFTSQTTPRKSDKSSHSVQPFVTAEYLGVCSDTPSILKDVSLFTALDPPLDAYTPEWTAMAKIILQDCFTENFKSLEWSDVIGHERAKLILKEAVVYPIKYSLLFSTHNTAWRSVLLYGPSGTGKTLLAQVAAAKCEATFLKVSLSTLVSKWRGESEKLVKVLFDLAKKYSPSIIFIDEIDSLMSHRGCDHEASRRMKTEFFLQMDALQREEKLFVVVLGASNLPWELDYAILRRMEKRVLVPLPHMESRIDLFKKFLFPNIKVNKNRTLQNILDYDEFARATEHYSAADIELVCKEVKMNCIRRGIDRLENPCDGENSSAKPDADPIQMVDVLTAIERTKPTSSHLVEKYEEWKNMHGSD